MTIFSRLFYAVVLLKYLFPVICALCQLESFTEINNFSKCLLKLVPWNPLFFWNWSLEVCCLPAHV